MTIDKKNFDVRLKVRNMSFSAHADSKGIMNLIKHCEPESVVLVHGEKNRMEVFSEVVRETLKIPCYYPANFEDLYIPVKARDQSYPVALSKSISHQDLMNPVDAPLLLVRRGEGLLQKTMIERELLVKTKKLEAPAKPNEELVDEEKELRVLPHKVVRFAAKDYK